MFKLFFILPLMFVGLVAGAALLPLAIVACVFTVALGAIAFALRLTGAILAGVGSLLCGVFGLVLFVGMLAIGLAVFGAVLGALSHLIVPILFIVGVVWLARRLARPQPPVLRHY